MDISYTSLIAIAQIIPILLLASYFDKDVLDKIRTYNNYTRYSWLLIIFITIVGEYIALIAIMNGSGVDGIRALTVQLAVYFALFNLISIASWRIMGYDLATGMPYRAKKQKKSKKR